MARHNEKHSDCAIGFKAGQSPDGGLGLEREVSPTLSATPSALEPTVCHAVRSPRNNKPFVIILHAKGGAK